MSVYAYMFACVWLGILTCVSVASFFLACVHACVCVDLFTFICSLYVVGICAKVAVFMHICLHMCVCGYAYMLKWLFLYAYMHVCFHMVVNMHMCRKECHCMRNMLVDVLVYMYAFAYACLHVFVCMCMYVHMCVLMSVRMRACVFEYMNVYASVLMYGTYNLYILMPCRIDSNQAIIVRLLK